MSAIATCPRCGAPIVELELECIVIELDAQTRQGVVQLGAKAEVQPVFTQHGLTCKFPAAEPEQGARR